MQFVEFGLQEKIDRVQPGAGGVIKDPGLITGAVKILDETAPVLRGAGGSMHEKNRRFFGIVGLKEKNIAAGPLEVFQRRPKSGGSVFGGKGRVVEVCHKSGGSRRLAFAAGKGCQTAGKRRRRFFAGSIEHYVQSHDDTAHLRFHRIGLPVEAARFTRVIGEGSVDVLKGKNFIAPLLGQQFVLPGLRQYGIIGDLDDSVGPAVGDHDNGFLLFGRMEDFAEKQAGILGNPDVLAQLEKRAAAKRRDDHDHKKDTDCF